MSQRVHLGCCNGVRFFKERVKRRRGAAPQYRILVAPHWAGGLESARDEAFTVGDISRAGRHSWQWLMTPSQVRKVATNTPDGAPLPVLRGWSCEFGVAADDAMHAFTVFLAQHDSIALIVPADRSVRGREP